MSRYARFDGDVFQTPVRTFAHPWTHQQVTLAGMMHIGGEVYYAQVRAHVEKLAARGAVVLCEGAKLDPLRRPPDEDLTDIERAVLGALTEVEELSRAKVAQALGWTDQLSASPNADGWLVCDLPPLEIFRRLGPDVIRARFGRMARMLDWPPRSTLRPNLLVATTRISMLGWASDQPACNAG